MFRFAQHDRGIYAMCSEQEVPFNCSSPFATHARQHFSYHELRRDQSYVTRYRNSVSKAERFGSAILVEGAGTKLLFDCGRGVVIRLTQAGVSPKEIDALFLTHLHSDHVVGIPDLWLSGWLLGRSKPLPIWGPQGTSSMAKHLAQAFGFDIHIRQAAPDPLPAEGVEIDAKEIEQGEIFNDGLARVSAFLVDHGAVKPAFGYRIDSANHSVVISGDTKFCQTLVDFARGADCLIHAAWSASWKNPAPPSMRSI